MVVLERKTGVSGLEHSRPDTVRRHLGVLQQSGTCHQDEYYVELSLQNCGLEQKSEGFCPEYSQGGIAQGRSGFRRRPGTRHQDEHCLERSLETVPSIG